MHWASGGSPWNNMPSDQPPSATPSANNWLKPEKFKGRITMPSNQPPSASHDDGPSDTPQEWLQHPTSQDIQPPPPSTPPPPSPPPPPEYYKWQVCTGKDDYGNKIWVEYPKHVAEILEYMYNHPLMHEEQTYMYEWTNILSKKRTVLSARCQVV